MRKTKEDAELTKQNLLEAAFQLFFSLIRVSISACRAL